MKAIISIVLLLFLGACHASDESSLSDKLGLSVKTHDGDPASWLRQYTESKEKSILIFARFDINNVKKVLISDVYAQEGKCGSQQTEHLFYLAVNPETNLKELATRIDKPCLVDRDAVLKLQVELGDGTRFYNTAKFTAHPLAQIN